MLSHPRSIAGIAVAGAVIIIGAAEIARAPRDASVAPPEPSPGVSAVASPTLSPEASAPAPSPYAEPVAQFRARATKKVFGTYVTPENSPVQPERFRGYHTGVDSEYGDVQGDVPVYAIADGTVVRSGWTSGYGGLAVIQSTVEGRSVYVLYGHLRPSTLPSVSATVARGEIIGMLGTEYSHETDGERRHLHLAIYTGTSLDVRGYVPSASDLKQWIDPLTLYP